MVFVTGGTGLLGAHVLVELSKRGQPILALKRNSSSTKMTEAIFQYFFKDQSEALFNQIEWVEGNILDVNSLKSPLQRCNIVYHCAGKVSFHKRDFHAMMKINKEGTANMVNVALSVGIEKFCHVSSTAAIGRDVKTLLYTEENKWQTSNENSNYAVSKYSAEMEVWRSKEEGLNVTIVNPSVIIGAGFWTESSLEIFDTVSKGLKYYPSGMNAFVDARDVAYCMVELVEKNKMGDRYLTISQNVFFKDLLSTIATKMSVKKPSVAVKPWMVELGWRLEKIKAIIFARKPKITKETARSAMSISKYNNQKIKTAIGIDFIPIEDAIENAISFHDFIKNNK
ncbi:hypothetical protein DNU06_12490 [Putridiphycobacter roseus]|uniref:NAD-dependent epimerase/dehydratase domain-containing protein n=1 Tax=Putridiphycobacter roseus TaxID=2219161 RepID=A0A2W1NF20_9FLAO|nr:NAD-dependent epimerase/dehydratase family protein [Putridiphycobacter roseus]PZE16666.1 hypothetical protein DNU06_12490 [Putridiphycobacter roseus]